jgi:hypothetical protein
LIVSGTVRPTVKSDSRPVSTKVAAQLAALDVPSVVETQATIAAAMQAIPLCELALLLHIPYQTLQGWRKGTRAPTTAARYYVGHAIRRLMAERRRKEKRHREYLRRKATIADGGSANHQFSADQPMTMPRGGQSDVSLA